ncbi:hypothetical protein AJ79_09987 [Helicocarpus griseus UAMH5409]|uniref:Ribosomal protein s17 n=1 Tax=Helicocarpus griseus UAMH5409 TaxID=1447875 RepID=A0A2B7WFV3_9EURO|nr:hypothetical protein AJ79_09987 [Helicocarpus griseus UAMH5409]
MQYKGILLALVLSSGLLDVVVGEDIRARQFGGGVGGFGGFGGFGGGQGGQGQGQNNGQNNQGNNGQNNGQGNQDDQDNGGNNGNLALDPDNVQDASQDDGTAEAEEGQAASLTDDANFINFCSGKTLTNGLQQDGGSCNGIVMGDIPARTNMVSCIILNPQSGDDLEENTDFTIDIQVDNLVAGSFTNPDVTYYSAPQQLVNGNVEGHSHVTIQSLGDINTQTPPDPDNFVFFKGINDAGDGQGGLSADVEGGLPAGAYRLCTMNSASNHQPVIMPVAQRGAQDDCIRFTVGQGNGGNNQNDQDNQDDQNNQDDNGQDNQNNGQDNNGQNNGQGQNQGGQGQGGQGGGFGGGGFGGFGRNRNRFGRTRGRRPFTKRSFIA